MHLMYYIDPATGKRSYTLKKEIDPSDPTSGMDKKITESAHPARFSPDDKYSSQRVRCKKRFGLYLPDLPGKVW
eukprot:CAMPEP_0194322154 /NCGR_PEP_ID=MMETSP0171-20130528/18324_1 /TAXON_ID=218684 /ORGANISM="Corethron pennatum, Strain L29A3" /LENGTH=73 /DNA_ID=CAMNT_0039080335 /DNA_START=40 /DNA_END=258 /DNA_ORIENTATION=-